MKQLVKLLLITSVLISSPAWSCPIQYTLEGTIIAPYFNDSAGFLARQGLSVGSTVSYTIIIDLNSMGTINYADGSIAQYTDPSGRPTFYAQYVSGSTMTGENYLSTYNGLASSNYGGAEMVINGQLHEYWLGISTGNNFLNIMDILENPDSSGLWSVGSPNAFGAAVLFNSIYDQSGNNSKFWFDAKITSAEIVPVPEPATLILIGSGLAGFIIRKKGIRV